MFINAGVGYYAFALFYKPLEVEFGWDRGAVSVAFTIYFIIQGLAAPFIGRMVDRYGVKKLITLGSLISGSGFLSLTFTHSLWSFYVSYVVTGFGMAAMGVVPTTHIVSNWFIKKRGFAVGIMATGIGAGALVLAPIAGSYLIPAFSWRAAYLAFGILTWVLIIPAALLVIKARPSDIGLYPDGAETPDAIAEAAPHSQGYEGWTLSDALKSFTFWLIALAFITSDCSNTGTVIHQFNHITDLGFPVAAAATVLGGVGFCSAIGKVFFGWLCDRIKAKHAAAISFALQLASIVVLVTLKSTSSVAIIWLYAILMGLGQGGWLPTMSMLVSGYFGLASYGAIFGAVNVAHSLGVAFGPLIAGQMFDATQTYTGVFVTFVALYMIAIPSVLTVRPPKSRLVCSN